MKTSIVEYEGDQLEIDFNGDRGTPSLSIPCLIKQPNHQPLVGLIVGDRGDKFDVKVNDKVQTVSKLYVFPNFPPPKKCRTDREITPRKKSRRRKGKGSGYINWQEIKKNGKNYKQTWFHYELWDKGRQVKSSVYILGLWTKKREVRA